jgi:hypothetical protein
MGIVDGTPVDAAHTNPHFLNTDADSQGLGIYDFLNANPDSGPGWYNLQRTINALSSWLGMPIASVYNALKTWGNSEGFTPSQSVSDRVNDISGKFNKTTGHAHDGSDGNGAPVAAALVASVPLRTFAELQSVTGAVGASSNVSMQMTGKVASVLPTVKGVVVVAPYNRTTIRDMRGALILDPFGNIVYAQLSEAAGVWTLAYFVDILGVATSYSLPAAIDINWYYLELFNPLQGYAPAYDLTAAMFPSSIPSYVERIYPIALAANVLAFTTVTELTLDLTQFHGCDIDYVITEAVSGKRRKGRLEACSDGTLTPEPIEVGKRETELLGQGDDGIEWKPLISGTNLLFQYKNTDAVNGAVMEAFVRRYA